MDEFVGLFFSPSKVHIVKGDFLPELAKLLVKEKWPEAQCHAAGTLRNLAAEKQTMVSEELC